MYVQTLIMLLLAGMVLCSTNDIDVDDIQKKLEQEIPNADGMPDLEEIEKVIKEKCDKNGGEDAFNKIQLQKDALQTCIQSNINVTEAQAEVEEAKKTGSMDEVFAKYCKRIPDVMQCVTNVTDLVEPCLEEKEKDSLVVIRNVTESLLNFTCFKDGDRLAMFVAEGGVECLEEQKDALQNCANKTISGKVPDDLNVSNLPLLIFSAQECRSFDEFHQCAVTELERCKDNAPANIVDALLKFVRKVTPCNNFKKSIPLASTSEKEKSNGATLNFSIVTSVWLALFVKYF